MRLNLSGPVIPDGDQWLYDYFEIPAFSPGVIREAIKQTGAGEALELEINSGGGDVFAGFEMYSILRGAECPTVAIVQSLAASAASTMMIGCDRVQLTPVAQVMIHLPATGTYGDQEDHRRSTEMLDSITESILNAYELKCGDKTPRTELRAMMDRTSWLSAQDAIAAGLADEVLYMTEPMPTNVVNAVGGSIRTAVTNGLGLQDSTALLRRYEDAVRAGTSPALPGHPVAAPQQTPAQTESNPCDDWRTRARLNIEKNRF